MRKNTKELYTVFYDECSGKRHEIKVVAQYHEQHIWSETTLHGVSKSGEKKLQKLASEAQNHHTGLSVVIAHREIRLIGWR
jgi:hypothetical protein